MSSDKKTPDWIAIEGAYLAGGRSVCSIASEHGISETAIRKKAKKFGWVRDPSATVREKVKAHFSGVGSCEGSSAVAARTMVDAVQSSISFMELGEENAQRIMQRVKAMIGSVEAPRDLKTLVEANAGAVETIRRIRQLDDPVTDNRLSKEHRDRIYAAALKC